jgi:hypothetical protein
MGKSKTFLLRASWKDKVTGIEDLLNSLCGSNVVPVVGRGKPRLTSVAALDMESVLASKLGKFGFNMLLHQGSDIINIHIRDRTDRELANNLGRNNSLVTRVIESTLYTVNRQGRISPTVLQHFTCSLVNTDIATNSTVKFVHLEGEVIIGFVFFLYKHEKY